MNYVEKCKDEGDVKKYTKKALTDRRWSIWMPPANGFGRSGISDINALRDGVFIAIETKFGRNKPTPGQKLFLKMIHDAGGLAFVVNEDNLEWFVGWLDAFDRAALSASKKEPVSSDDGAYMLNAIDKMTTGFY